MPRITTDVAPELAREIERIVRDGWYPSADALLQEAVRQFVEGRSFLADSPALLHRFAADALNDSKPEVALKFANRALLLLQRQETFDRSLYQALVELRVQTMLVLGRTDEAIAALEEAREVLPNSPSVSAWLDRLGNRRS